MEMGKMPTSDYVDVRNNGYYVAGTRISLDSVACAIRRGESVDEILADFPVLRSRHKLEGAIDFIRTHAREVNAYLSKRTQAWEEARKLNPPELVEKARKYRKQGRLKSA